MLRALPAECTWSIRRRVRTLFLSNSYHRRGTHVYSLSLQITLRAPIACCALVCHLLAQAGPPKPAGNPLCQEVDILGHLLPSVRPSHPFNALILSKDWRDPQTKNNKEKPTLWNEYYKYYFILFTYFAVRLELKALHLLGKHSTTWAIQTSPFCFWCFSDRVLCFCSACPWSVTLLLCLSSNWDYRH
jgi:hypothetical protein